MSKETSFSSRMKIVYRKAVRTLGYALSLGDQKAWWGMVPILMAHLTVMERASLAFMALKSLDYETSHMTAEAALDRGTGFPLPPLVNFMDEAAFWADMADPDELEAYCLATYNRMAPGRQAAFLNFVNGRATA